MNTARTDSDRYALSTQIDADRGAYHLSIDAGPRHIAYADIRRGRSTVELSIDVASGDPSLRLRRRLIDAVFDLEVMRTGQTLLATLPLGDVELLDCVARHCTNVQTRSAGCSCLVDGYLLE